MRRDDQHNFKIYRKDTQTNHTLHTTSNHPYTHKMAAYNSYVHRLLNIPMNKEDFENEKHIIQHIAISNGYNPEIIDKIINKKCLFIFKLY